MSGIDEHKRLDTAIRKVRDFPKPGILFYDITGILAAPESFRYCVDELCRRRPPEAEAIAAVEARGFVFAAPVASRLGLPLVLVRKRGKLPGETLSRTFTLEYGEDELFVQRIDVPAGRKFMLIDDLVATGGTLRAAADLLVEAGGVIVSVCCVIGLTFLHYDRTFPEIPISTLIDYDHE